MRQTERYPHSTAIMRPVQHCPAISTSYVMSSFHKGVCKSSSSQSINQSIFVCSSLSERKPAIHNSHTRSSYASLPLN